MLCPFFLSLDHSHLFFCTCTIPSLSLTPCSFPPTQHTCLHHSPRVYATKFLLLPFLSFKCVTASPSIVPLHPLQSYPLHSSPSHAVLFSVPSPTICSFHLTCMLLPCFLRPSPFLLSTTLSRSLFYPFSSVNTRLSPTPWHANFMHIPIPLLPDCPHPTSACPYTSSHLGPSPIHPSLHVLSQSLHVHYYGLSMSSHSAKQTLHLLLHPPPHFSHTRNSLFTVPRYV